ncbi:UNVERIFIED_CONTAM: hypothetical protein HDU68_012509 [Siphonaria sp. JEL0065]|nr:hypothetical protein HDU68_012509 [Siphonaria sp. JEL0065]
MRRTSAQKESVNQKFSMEASKSLTINKSAEELRKEDEWILKLRQNIRYTAGTLVMMFSSSQILMAYVLEPQSVNRSYQSFLLTHGGIRHHAGSKARDYLLLMAHIIRKGFAGFSTKYLVSNQLATSSIDPTSLPPSYESNLPTSLDATKFAPYFGYINQAPHDYVMCSLQHPTTPSCELGALEFMSQEAKRALQMYLPLNAIMTIIFRGKSLSKQPGKNLYWYLLGTARSTLYYVNGLLSGSMVLIESPGRRLELGLYCLPRALESLWNCGVKWRWWRDIAHGEGIYFSLMTGVLMALYQKDPASIHEG